jgi:hypothetical protein
VAKSGNVTGHRETPPPPVCPPIESPLALLLLPALHDGQRLSSSSPRLPNFPNHGMKLTCSKLAANQDGWGGCNLAGAAGDQCLLIHFQAGGECVHSHSSHDFSMTFVPLFRLPCELWLQLAWRESAWRQQSHKGTGNIFPTHLSKRAPDWKITSKTG